MAFLEKYAKLKSEVDRSGERIIIYVYDDEMEDKEPIMWINFVHLDRVTLYEDTENDEIDAILESADIDDFIHVDMVNFNDNIYFNLPQNKQDACATVLFKRFITYYREEFEDLPVRADFQNFALQEKFELAVKKGIFPEESLIISEYTNKEEWDNEKYYNRDAREELWQIKNVVFSIFEEQGIQLEDEKWVIGTPISQFENVLNSAIQELRDKYGIEVQTEDRLNVDHSDTNGFIYSVPIEGFARYNASFEYSLNDRTFYTYMYSNFIKNHEEEFRNIFDTTENIFVSMKGRFGVDEFFTNNEINSSKIKRLLKKGTY